MFVSRDHDGFGCVKKDLVKYNWLRADFLQFKQKYGVNKIVVLNEALEYGKKQGLGYELV